MNELALRQQRTVDRIALVGSAIAILGATAFVTLDPVQTVARRSSPAVPAHAAAAAPVAATPERSPLVQLSLPSPAWTVVSDGTWAAYARLAKDEPAEIIVRSLHADDSRVAYRAGTSSYIGQLSLSRGVLALEEILQSGTDGRRAISVRALTVSTGEVTLIDRFEPTRSLTASPVTDGSRVLWIRPGTSGDEIREFDLVSGKTRIVRHDDAQIAALAIGVDAIAYTVFSGETAKTFVLDPSTGAATPVDGFAYSYIQSVGPDGVVVTGAVTAGSPAASWLVRPDAAKTRLGSDCLNVTMTARVLAMRCASQIEIRDLATASSLYRFAGNAGALAVFDDGVVWGEGDELMLYELPALSDASRARPE